jgi:hypothetical protein
MNNKLQLIETQDYILAVSDEKMKEGDTIYASGGLWDGTVTNAKWSDFLVTNCWQKIIAHLPKNNTPELNLPLLPQIVVEDDVEKLAEKANGYAYYGKPNGEKYLAFNEGFIEGHKAATKVYSEEDMIKFAEYCRDVARREGTYGDEFTNNWELCKEQKIVTTKGLLDSFKSFKQPKTPKWFVAEMEDKIALDVHTVTGKELKITTINGKTYLVGTYEY